MSRLIHLLLPRGVGKDIRSLVSVWFICYRIFLLFGKPSTSTLSTTSPTKSQGVNISESLASLSLPLSPTITYSSLLSSCFAVYPWYPSRLRRSLIINPNPPVLSNYLPFSLSSGSEESGGCVRAMLSWIRSAVNPLAIYFRQMKARNPNQSSLKMIIVPGKNKGCRHIRAD